jgi:hypothetical protein
MAVFFEEPGIIYIEVDLHSIFPKAILSLGKLSSTIKLVVFLRKKNRQPPQAMVEKPMAMLSSS